MLKIVGEYKSPKLFPVAEALSDHYSLIDGYIASQRARGLAPSSILRSESLIQSWFELHGPEGRPLYIWEAMDSLTGRKHILDYRDLLVANELQTSTIRSYMGTLRQLFNYVLLHPVISRSEPHILIHDKYAVNLSQPVSDFDMPAYIWVGEKKGIPLDPERLYKFYQILREEYLGTDHWLALRERNYAMVVLAGESGLRVDELLNLDVGKDIFFESKKLQTRHAKGTKGTGKRNRVTVLTPLSRDTLKYFLKTRRKYWSVDDSGYLFLSKSGSRLTYTAVQLALKKMVAVAQNNNFEIMDHLTWHWFRRIFATRFVEKFPNKTPVLLELMGHMSPNTIHRYIRHSEAWMDDQIQEALEGAGKWQSDGS